MPNYDARDTLWPFLLYKWILFGENVINVKIWKYFQFKHWKIPESLRGHYVQIYCVKVTKLDAEHKNVQANEEQKEPS